MPLSERQRKMLLTDTYGVAQQSTKAPNETTSGKSPITINVVISDSIVFERVLPTQPSPSPSQNIPISQTLSTNIIIPQTVTSKPPIYDQHKLGYATVLESHPSTLPSSISNPPISAPYTKNQNFTTSKRSPSRDSGNLVSEGTPEGMLNFEPEPEVSDSERHEANPSPFPTVFGPDPHPTITDLSVRIPSQPKPIQTNVGKILKKFES